MFRILYEFYFNKTNHLSKVKQKKFIEANKTYIYVLSALPVYLSDKRLPDPFFSTKQVDPCTEQVVVNKIRVRENSAH